MKLLEILLVIVIGAALVGTVATSTNSASTSLAGFTSSQALVVLLPLLFVAIIILGAYEYVSKGRNKRGILAFDTPVPIFAIRVLRFAASVFKSSIPFRAQRFR